MENTKSKSKKKNEIKEHNEQLNIETAIQKVKQYRKSIHKDDRKMFDDFFRIN